MSTLYKDKNDSQFSAAYDSYLQLGDEPRATPLQSTAPSVSQFTTQYPYEGESTAAGLVSSYSQPGHSHLADERNIDTSSRRFSVQSTSLLLSPNDEKDYTLFEPGAPLIQRQPEKKFCCCIPPHRKRCCKIFLLVFLVLSIVFAIVFYFVLLPFVIKYSFENVSPNTLLKYMTIPDDGDPAKLPFTELRLSFMNPDPGLSVFLNAVGPSISFLFFKLYVNPATWAINTVAQGKTSQPFVQVQLPALSISFPGKPVLPLNITVALPSLPSLASFVNELLTAKGLSPDVGKISLTGLIDYFTYGFPMRPVRIDRHIDFSGYNVFSFAEELLKFMPKNYIRFKGLKLSFGADGNDVLINLQVFLDVRTPIFLLIPHMSLNIHVSGESLISVKIAPIEIKNGEYALALKVRLSFALSLDMLIQKMIVIGTQALQEKRVPKTGVLPPILFASVPNNPTSPPIPWMSDLTKLLKLDLPMDLIEMRFSTNKTDLSKLVKIKVASQKQDMFPTTLVIGEGDFALPSTDLSGLSGSVNLYASTAKLVTLGFGNISLTNGLRVNAYAKLHPESAPQWEKLVHLEAPFDFFIRELSIGNNPLFPDFNFRIPIPADPVEAISSLLFPPGGGGSGFDFSTIPLRDFSLTPKDAATLSIAGFVKLPIQVPISIFVDLPISLMFGISSAAGQANVSPLVQVSVDAKFDLMNGIPIGIAVAFKQEEASQSAFASFFNQPQLEMVVTELNIGEVTALSKVRWVRLSMQTFKKLFSIVQAMVTGNRKVAPSNDPITKLIFKIIDSSLANLDDSLGNLDAQSVPSATNKPSNNADPPGSKPAPDVFEAKPTLSASSLSFPKQTTSFASTVSSSNGTSSTSPIPLTSFDALTNVVVPLSPSSSIATTGSSFSTDTASKASSSGSAKSSSTNSSPTITPPPELSPSAYRLNSILKKRDLSSRLPSFLVNVLKSPLLSLIKSVYLGPSKATPGAIEFAMSIHLPNIPIIKEIVLPSVSLTLFFNQVHLLNLGFTISPIRPGQSFDINDNIVISSALVKAWPTLSLQSWLFSIRELRLGQIMTFQKAQIDMDVKAMLGSLISFPPDLGFLNFNALQSLNLDALNNLLNKLPFKIQAQVEGLTNQPQFVTKLEIEFLDLPLEYTLHTPFQIALKLGPASAPSTTLLRLFADPKITRGSHIRIEAILEFNSQPQAVEGLAKFSTGQSSDVISLTDLQFLGCSSLASLQVFSFSYPQLMSTIQSLLGGLGVGNIGAMVSSQVPNPLTALKPNNPSPPTGPSSPPPPTSPIQAFPAPMVPGLVNPIVSTAPNVPNPVAPLPMSGLPSVPNLQPTSPSLANPSVFNAPPKLPTSFLGQNPPLSPSLPWSGASSSQPPLIPPAQPPNLMMSPRLSKRMPSLPLMVTPDATSPHQDSFHPFALLRRQLSSADFSVTSTSSSSSIEPSSTTNTTTNPTTTALSFDSTNDLFFNSYSSSTTTTSSSSTSLPALPSLLSNTTVNSPSNSTLFESRSTSPPSFSSNPIPSVSLPPISSSLPGPDLSALLPLPPAILSLLTWIQQCDIAPITEANHQGLSVKTTIRLPKFPVVTMVSLPAVTLSFKLNELEIISIHLAPIKIVIAEQKLESSLDLRFSTSQQVQQSLAGFSFFKPFQVGAGGLSIGVATTFSKVFVSLPVSLPNPIDALTSPSSLNNLNLVLKILNLKDIRVNISDSAPEIHIVSSLGAFPLPFSFHARIPITIAMFADVAAPSSAPFMKVALEINAKKDVPLNIPIVVSFSTDDAVKADVNALISGKAGATAVDPQLSIGGLEIGTAKLFAHLRLLCIRRSQIVSLIMNAAGNAAADPMQLISMMKNLKMEPSESRPGYNIAVDIMIPALPLPISSIQTASIKAKIRMFGVPIMESILSPNVLQPSKGSFNQALSAIFDNSEEVIVAIARAQNRVLSVGFGGLVIGGITTFDTAYFDLSFDLGDIPQMILTMAQNPNAASAVTSIIGNVDLKQLIVIKSINFAKDSPVIHTQVDLRLPPQLFRIFPIHYLNLGPNVLYINAADRFFVGSQLSSIVITPSSPVISLLSKLEFSNAEDSQGAVAAWVNSILGRSKGHVKLSVTGLQFAAEQLPVKTFSKLSLDLPVKQLVDIAIFGRIGSEGDLLIAMIDKFAAMPKAPAPPSAGGPLMMNLLRNVFLQQKSDSPSYDFVSDVFLPLPLPVTLPSFSVDYYGLKVFLDEVLLVTLSASSPLVIAGNGNMRIATNALFSNTQDIQGVFAKLVNQLLEIIGEKGFPAGVNTVGIGGLVFGGGTPESKVLTFQKLSIPISLPYLLKKFVAGKIKMPPLSIRDLPFPKLKFESLFKVVADLDIPLELPIPVALDLGGVFVNVYMGDMIIAHLDIPEIRKAANSRVLSVVGTRVEVLPKSSMGGGGGLLSNFGTLLKQGLKAIFISNAVLIPPGTKDPTNANSVRTFAMAKFRLP